jgi:peptidoglycan hydrolase-like protein with peptidoglycan-binding domain
VKLPNPGPSHRGQQSISEDRTREIQEALIREHYLEGEPSGVMDSDTRNALIKLQTENGWQTRLVPDSRALIKLGLGPNRDGLLNPESAAGPSAPPNTAASSGAKPAR